MKRAVALGLVCLQFVLLAALVLVPPGTLWRVGAVLLTLAIVLGAIGVSLAALGLAGLGSALTASPIPREHATLVTGGVYGFVRHPVYTGLLLGGLGLVLFGASVWHIIAWFALVVLLVAKTRWEERMLTASHPDYRRYAARVGRFLPGVGRLRERG
ncbi:MAG: methyltransferase family protein [Lacisediminihabitans sp.]